MKVIVFFILFFVSNLTLNLNEMFAVCLGRGVPVSVSVGKRKIYAKLKLTYYWFSDDPFKGEKKSTKLITKI